jgi:hypothetical protein
MTREMATREYISELSLGLSPTREAANCWPFNINRSKSESQVRIADRPL